MYIEDYLELLAGLQVREDATDYQFSLFTTDVKLLTSLAKQVKQNIGLTDRQYELTKKKLLEYREQFEKNGFFDLDRDLENLRIDLRTIDRSKTVQLVEKEYFDLFSNNKILMLAIRFPYSNKMIKYINFIKEMQLRREYDSKTKTHFIPFTENNVLKVVDKLNVANFDIQKEIIDYYNQVKNFKDSPEKYQPGIYNFKLKHVHTNCKNYLINLLGEPSSENLALYYDRRNEFGLGYFDSIPLQNVLQKYSNLSNRLLKNTNKQVLIDSNEFKLYEIYNALNELQKFPLLVVLKHGYEADNLIECFKSVTNQNDIKNISVMFRLENNTEKNIQFNNLVKQFELNNKLNNETKVVILNNEKLPKPLLYEKWKPHTTLLFDTFRSNKQLSIYYNEANLIINYNNKKVSVTNPAAKFI